MGDVKDFRSSSPIYRNQIIAKELRTARIHLSRECPECQNYAWTDVMVPVAKSGSGWHHPSCRMLRPAK